MRPLFKVAIEGLRVNRSPNIKFRYLYHLTFIAHKEPGGKKISFLLLLETHV